MQNRAEKKSFEERAVEDCEWMQALDNSFQVTSGLDRRREYKIFYSRIHRFPLLILGHNPGGKKDGTDLCASDTFFESWEHDYVEFRNHPIYKIAGPMCTLLSRCLNTDSDDVLRKIPVSNVIFRRSRNTDELRPILKEAICESKPFLEQLIIRVDPIVVLLISIGAYDIFTTNYCSDLREEQEKTHYTWHRKKNVRTFVSATARIKTTEKNVRLLAIGHPSTFAKRYKEDWEAITIKLENEFERLGLRPIEETDLLIPLDDLHRYG